MSEPTRAGEGALPADADAALKRATELIEREEGATHRLKGWLAWVIGGLAVAASLFHLYAAYGIVPTQLLRPVHVAII
ncbi:MAG: C4-dicarboxylate ABC transporter permease, partial [Alphaproteobacteria bacterium]|nr:C4-dicarboxylate ABC transporter permease [Alphaproteobacteria bacterium]